MSAGATLRGADAIERLERLSIGETLEIETTGVPLWNIPAEIRRARITAENLEPIRADARAEIEHGGAALRILEELER